MADRMDEHSWESGAGLRKKPALDLSVIWVLCNDHLVGKVPVSDCLLDALFKSARTTNGSIEPNRHKLGMFRFKMVYSNSD